jgi:hypothetical protein
MKLMKVLTAFLIGFGMFAFTINNSQDVPQKVKDALTKMFPNAKSVKWDKESETEWEAEFKMDKIEYSANFLEDGTWQETEREIKEKDLPQNVKTAFLKAFEGYDIEEIGLSETPKGSVYEFDIEKGETDMEVAIDLTGNVVKKEIKKEEDSDKD